MAIGDNEQADQMWSRVDENTIAQNVKQTGSKTLLWSELNYQVTAGSNSTVESNVDLKAFSKFALAIRSDEEHDFQLRLEYRVSDFSIDTRVKAMHDVIVVENDDRGVSEHIEAVSDLILVNIQNDSGSDRNYDVYVWGVE